MSNFSFTLSKLSPDNEAEDDIISPLESLVTQDQENTHKDNTGENNNTETVQDSQIGRAHV